MCIALNDGGAFMSDAIPSCRDMREKRNVSQSVVVVGGVDGDVIDDEWARCEVRMAMGARGSLLTSHHLYVYSCMCVYTYTCTFVYVY